MPSDYVCQLCKGELPNNYYHCMGCEQLLQKDFNICKYCFHMGLHMQNIHMHRTSTRMHSEVHHCALPNKLQKGRGCCCHEGICSACRLCRKCSCKCHHNMQLMQRFMTVTELQKTLADCKNIAEAVYTKPRIGGGIVGSVNFASQAKHKEKVKVIVGGKSMTPLLDVC